MFNFKLLFKCCCENASGAEEEKIERGPLPRTEKPPLSKFRPSELDLTNNLKSIEDSAIIAAPSPLQQDDSMGYPKLQLKVIESTAVQVGTILHITSLGMEDSKRGKTDCKTYIGSQGLDNGEIINDFVVDERALGMGRQHLVIKFHSSDCKYWISDLGDGTGTFARVGSELILRQSYIISFGSSHMKVMSIGSPTSLDKKIVIKFLEGPKINEEFTFQPSDDIILVGRMADCRIRFDDSNLSRYQCNISFHPLKGWILKDGIGDKKSTNGTWLYVEEEFEVYQKLIFKAGKTLFEATLE